MFKKIQKKSYNFRIAEDFLNETQKARPFKIDQFNILKIKYVHQRALQNEREAIKQDNIYAVHMTHKELTSRLSNMERTSINEEKR